MATALVSGKTSDEFSTWLTEKLRELNTDECIFSSYIQGILESDESFDEQTEALQGILSEIVENESAINTLCSEIVEKWHCCKSKNEPPTSSVANSEDVIDEKLVKLMESQSLAATTKQKNRYTEEERKIREAILSQYSQMTDDEDDQDEKNNACVGGSGGGGGGGGLPSSSSASSAPSENVLQKNTNVQSVLQAEKQKREQAKLDSQRKKERDKEDREKQKQQREEKKEKRKTQKQERRR